MHFDLKGNIDRYDDKIYLFLLPAIATVLFWVLKYITTKPHIFNYPYEINEGNYKAAYKSATNMLHFLKLILLIVFSVVQYTTYSAITNQHLKFSIWFLIIPLGALTIVPIFMALKSARKK